MAVNVLLKHPKNPLFGTPVTAEEIESKRKVKQKELIKLSTADAQEQWENLARAQNQDAENYGEIYDVEQLLLVIKQSRAIENPNNWPLVIKIFKKLQVEISAVDVVNLFQVDSDTLIDPRFIVRLIKEIPEWKAKIPLLKLAKSSPRYAEELYPLLSKPEQFIIFKEKFPNSLFYALNLLDLKDYEKIKDQFKSHYNNQRQNPRAEDRQDNTLNKYENLLKEKNNYVEQVELVHQHVKEIDEVLSLVEQYFALYKEIQKNPTDDLTAQLAQRKRNLIDVINTFYGREGTARGILVQKNRDGQRALESGRSSEIPNLGSMFLLDHPQAELVQFENLEHIRSIKEDFKRIRKANEKRETVLVKKINGALSELKRICDGRQYKIRGEALNKFFEFDADFESASDAQKAAKKAEFHQVIDNVKYLLVVLKQCGTEISAKNILLIMALLAAVQEKIQRYNSRIRDIDASLSSQIDETTKTRLNDETAELSKDLALYNNFYSMRDRIFTELAKNNDTRPALQRVFTNINSQQVLEHTPLAQKGHDFLRAHFYPAGNFSGDFTYLQEYPQLATAVYQQQPDAWAKHFRYAVRHAINQQGYSPVQQQNLLATLRATNTGKSLVAMINEHSGPNAISLNWHDYLTTDGKKDLDKLRSWVRGVITGDNDHFAANQEKLFTLLTKHPEVTKVLKVHEMRDEHDAPLINRYLSRSTSENNLKLANFVVGNEGLFKAFNRSNTSLPENLPGRVLLTARHDFDEAVLSQFGFGQKIWFRFSRARFILDYLANNPNFLATNPHYGYVLATAYYDEMAEINRNALNTLANTNVFLAAKKNGINVVEYVLQGNNFTDFFGNYEFTSADDATQDFIGFYLWNMADTNQRIALRDKHAIFAAKIAPPSAAVINPVVQPNESAASAQATPAASISQPQSVTKPDFRMVLKGWTEEELANAINAESVVEAISEAISMEPSLLASKKVLAKLISAGKITVENIQALSEKNPSFINTILEDHLDKLGRLSREAIERIRAFVSEDVTAQTNSDYWVALLKLLPEITVHSNNALIRTVFDKLTADELKTQAQFVKQFINTQALTAEDFSKLHKAGHISGVIEKVKSESDNNEADAGNAQSNPVPKFTTTHSKAIRAFFNSAEISSDHVAQYSELFVPILQAAAAELTTPEIAKLFTKPVEGQSASRTIHASYKGILTQNTSAIEALIAAPIFNELDLTDENTYELIDWYSNKINLSEQKDRFNVIRILGRDHVGLRKVIYGKLSKDSQGFLQLISDNNFDKSCFSLVKTIIPGLLAAVQLTDLSDSTIQKLFLSGQADESFVEHTELVLVLFKDESFSVDSERKEKLKEICKSLFKDNPKVKYLIQAANPTQLANMMKFGFAKEILSNPKLTAKLDISVIEDDYLDIILEAIINSPDYLDLLTSSSSTLADELKAKIINLIAFSYLLNLSGQVSDPKVSKIVQIFINDKLRDQLLPSLAAKHILVLVVSSPECREVFFKPQNRSGKVIFKLFREVLSKLDINSYALKLLEDSTLVTLIEWNREKLRALVSLNNPKLNEWMLKQAQITTNLPEIFPVIQFPETSIKDGIPVSDPVFISKLLSLERFQTLRPLTLAEAEALLKLSHLEITEILFSKYQSLIETLLNDKSATRAIFDVNPYFARRVIDRVNPESAELFAALSDPKNQKYTDELLSDKEHATSMKAFVATLQGNEQFHVNPQVKRLAKFATRAKPVTSGSEQNTPEKNLADSLLSRSSSFVFSEASKADILKFIEDLIKTANTLLHYSKYEGRIKAARCYVEARRLSEGILGVKTGTLIKTSCLSRDEQKALKNGLAEITTKLQWNAFGNAIAEPAINHKNLDVLSEIISICNFEGLNDLYGESIELTNDSKLYEILIKIYFLLLKQKNKIGENKKILVSLREAVTRFVTLAIECENFELLSAFYSDNKSNPLITDMLNPEIKRYIEGLLTNSVDSATANTSSSRLSPSNNLVKVANILRASSFINLPSVKVMKLKLEAKFKEMLTLEALCESEVEQAFLKLSDEDKRGVIIGLLINEKDASQFLTKYRLLLGLFATLNTGSKIFDIKLEEKDVEKARALLCLHYLSDKLPTDLLYGLVQLAYGKDAKLNDPKLAWLASTIGAEKFAALKQKEEIAQPILPVTTTTTTTALSGSAVPFAPPPPPPPSTSYHSTMPLSSPTIKDSSDSSPPVPSPAMPNFSRESMTVPAKSRYQRAEYSDLSLGKFYTSPFIEELNKLVTNADEVKKAMNEAIRNINPTDKLPEDFGKYAELITNIMVCKSGIDSDSVKNSMRIKLNGILKKQEAERSVPARPNIKAVLGEFGNIKLKSTTTVVKVQPSNPPLSKSQTPEVSIMPQPLSPTDGSEKKTVSMEVADDSKGTQPVGIALTLPAISTPASSVESAPTATEAVTLVPPSSTAIPTSLAAQNSKIGSILPVRSAEASDRQRLEINPEALPSASPIKPSPITDENGDRLASLVQTVPAAAPPPASSATGAPPPPPPPPIATPKSSRLLAKGTARIASSIGVNRTKKEPEAVQQTNSQVLEALGADVVRLIRKFVKPANYAQIEQMLIRWIAIRNSNESEKGIHEEFAEHLIQFDPKYDVRKAGLRISFHSRRKVINGSSDTNGDWDDKQENDDKVEKPLKLPDASDEKVSAETFEELMTLIEDKMETLVPKATVGMLLS